MRNNTKSKPIEEKWPVLGSLFFAILLCLLFWLIVFASPIIVELIKNAKEG